MKIVAKNKRAYHEYHILDKFEAGIQLQGTEVKSIRAGHAIITDGYIQIIRNEVFLLKANIGLYEMGSWTNHEPTRPRKLLLHRREINVLRTKLEEKGLTAIALALYFNSRNLIKLEFGIGRGKKLHDKRHDLKKKADKRDMDRAIKARNYE